MLGTEITTPECCYLGRLSGSEDQAWIKQIKHHVKLARQSQPEIKNIVAVLIQELELEHDYITNINHTLNNLGQVLPDLNVYLVCNTPNARVFEKHTHQTHYDVLDFKHRFGMFEVCASDIYHDRPQDVSWNPNNSDIIYMCGKNEHAHRVFPVITITESEYSDRFRYSFIRLPEPITPDMIVNLEVLCKNFCETYNLPDYQGVSEFYNRYHSILDVPESAMVIDATSQFVAKNPHAEPGRGYQHYTGRPIRNPDLYNSGKLFVISETTQWKATDDHNNLIDSHRLAGWYTEKTYRHINMGLPFITINRPDTWQHLTSDGFADISKFFGPSYQKYNDIIRPNTELTQNWYNPELSNLLIKSIDYFYDYCETSPGEISEALEHNRRLLNSSELWQDLDQILGQGVAKYLDQDNRYVNHTWYPDLQPEGQDHYLKGMHGIVRD